MGFIRYGKKSLDWDDLSGEEIFEKLSESLLDSGFLDRWNAGAQTIDDLRRALIEELLLQEVIPFEELERLMKLEDEQRQSQVDQIADRLLQRMIESGYLSVPELDEAPGSVGLPGRARFEVTAKGLDFLGFRALQETLGRVGRDAFGRHVTDRLATGVEAADAPKPYEFGDTLNLDPAATVLETVRRSQRDGLDPLRGGAGSPFPLEISEADLRVRQGELTVSSATVVMLDCSHSMILYGEDRFTPAKRVALALAHLIRTRYPGDELSLVLFHDSAEEVPIIRLPRVQIGPFHTNTAEGLRLARRILARSRRQLRQIVMITDGKPSALTLPDGRIYKNSFGLDPLILDATFQEVAHCRRAGIRINTFMLARDRTLVRFVRRVSEIARGRAYFTTPLTLGRFVTRDFLDRKIDLN